MEREALKLALEALENMCNAQSNPDRRNFPTIHDYGKAQRACIAIKAALAQPVQEPEMLTIAYQSGYYDGKQAARARCIELVLAGSSMPVQTKTLEALQRDRKRIAALIEEDGKP
jgi:hypothetical protein